MTTLETERLILRPLTEADASQRYADWLNDPEVNRFLETRHSAQTVDSCRVFIRQCNADPGSHLLGVFHKGSGQHIGNVKVGFINSHYERGQVSLFIGEKTLWGQGLSSELVREVTRCAFAELGLNRLEAGCYEDNLASLRVFLRCGYTVEGFMREQVILDGKRMGVFWLGMLKHEFN